MFFILYLRYEVSLFPIILIIIIWGSYSERSVGAILLLIFTSVFTVPFLLNLGSFFFLFFSFRFFRINYANIVGGVDGMSL